MCVHPAPFFSLLATQAQLHRTADSLWTGDEELRQHILRLLSPQLISKNGVLSFLFQAFSLGGWQREKQTEEGKGGRETVSEGERRGLGIAGLE